MSDDTKHIPHSDEDEDTKSAGSTPQDGAVIDPDMLEQLYKMFGVSGGTGVDPRFTKNAGSNSAACSSAG